jgi:hypothetical protein
MIRRRVRRLVFLLALCLTAVVLVVGFGAQFNGTDAYPDAAAIETDYANHVGERVHLWGTVTAVEDGTVIVAAKPLSLRASDPPPEEVAVGDGVQVYGTLQSDRRFETAAYHVQTPEGRQNMYLTSIVGIALAAGAFLRRWRVDTDRWTFVPRESE